MASLLDWFGKRARGVVAQLNPFDGGEDYNSVVNEAPRSIPQRPQAPQQQRRFDTGVDQFKAEGVTAPEKPKIDINANAELSKRTQQATKSVNERPQFKGIGDAIQGVGDFAAGANEALLGGATKGAVNIFNQFATGFNQDEANKRTNAFLQSTGQETKQGGSQLTKDAQRVSTPFKAGQVVGTGERIVADIATTALPGVGAEKIIRTVPKVANLLKSGNLGTRILGGTAGAVGGGAVSSAINQLKDPSQNAGQNFAQNAAFDVGTAVLPPALGALGRSFMSAPSIPRQVVNSPTVQAPTPVRQAVSAPVAVPESRVAPVNRVNPTTSPMNVPYNPMNGQEAVRGFTGRVAADDTLPDELRSALGELGGKYNIRNTQDLITRAGNLVDENRELAERIANSGNNDVAQAIGIELLRKNQLDGNYEAAIDRIEDIARKATESGRATQILSAYGKLTPEGALRFTQRQINRFNEERGLTGLPKAAKLSPELAERITNVSRQLQGMPDGLDKDRLVVELTQLMNTAAPTPLLQKLTSIWRAGLLTSARTLEGGALGNTTKAILDAPSQALAAGVDRFITAPLLNRGVRSNVFTLKGSATGAKEGVKQAGKYLKTGVDPRDAQMAYDTKGVNWDSGNKMLNTVGKGSDYVYRALGAVDNPFYYSALGRANREEALIEASRRGLKGIEAKRFADDFVRNMTPQSKDAAVQTAREAVFQNDTVLGDFASRIKGLPKSIKDPVKRDAVQAIVDFTIPFAKIPGAVATALVDYSPAGVFLKGAQTIIGKMAGRPADLRALNAAIGKSATGTIGSVWLGRELYNNGLLTLEEPTDEKERQLWAAEGKQKFSIKLGDRWYSMNYIQPLGGLLALGGGHERAVKNGDPFPIGSAAMAGIKSVTEQSFLQGVNDLVGLVDDPQRNANSFINSKVSSFIPNIVKDAARATDTVERETNNPMEAVKNSIPGLRQGSLPQRDPYGNPIERRQSPAGVFLDPFKSTQSRNDPVTQELRRLYDKDAKELGVVPTKLNKAQSLGGSDVQLTPEQLDTLEGTAGPATKALLQEAFNDPRYKKLSDEDKSKRISNIIDANRATAKKQLAQTETFKDKKGNDVAVDADKIKIPKISLNATGESESYADKYKSALEEFENDSKNWSSVEKASKQGELKKLKIQKDYDNDTIKLYGMDKDEVYNLVTTDDNGQKLLDSMVKYGDALVSAGIIKKNKFRDKYGNLNVAPSTSSGKKGGKKGKKTSGIDQASIRKLAYGSKIPTYDQPPKGTSAVGAARFQKTALKRYKSRVPTRPKLRAR